MPVADGAPEVLLCVVVVAPLGQPHGGHVLVDVDPGARPQSQHHAQESGARRVGQNRRVELGLEPPPYVPKNSADSKTKMVLVITDSI